MPSIVSYPDIYCAADAGRGEPSGKSVYHLTGTIPAGVSSRIYRRPFPTRPKLADVETAKRLSKNGEYLTAEPL